MRMDTVPTPRTSFPNAIVDGDKMTNCWEISLHNSDFDNEEVIPDECLCYRKSNNGLRILASAWEWVTSTRREDAAVPCNNIV